MGDHGLGPKFRRLSEEPETSDYDEEEQEEYAFGFVLGGIRDHLEGHSARSQLLEHILLRVKSASFEDGSEPRSLTISCRLQSLIPGSKAYLHLDFNYHYRMRMYSIEYFTKLVATVANAEGEVLRKKAWFSANGEKQRSFGMTRALFRRMQELLIPETLELSADDFQNLVFTLVGFESEMQLHIGLTDDEWFEKRCEKLVEGCENL